MSNPGFGVSETALGALSQCGILCPGHCGHERHSQAAQGHRIFLQRPSRRKRRLHPTAPLRLRRDRDKIDTVYSFTLSEQERDELAALIAHPHTCLQKKRKNVEHYEAFRPDHTPAGPSLPRGGLKVQQKAGCGSHQPQVRQHHRRPDSPGSHGVQQGQILQRAHRRLDSMRHRRRPDYLHLPHAPADRRGPAPYPRGHL